MGRKRKGQENKTQSSRALRGRTRRDTNVEQPPEEDIVDASAREEELKQRVVRLCREQHDAAAQAELIEIAENLGIAMPVNPTSADKARICYDIARLKGWSNDIFHTATLPQEYDDSISYLMLPALGHEEQRAHLTDDILQSIMTIPVLVSSGRTYDLSVLLGLIAQNDTVADPTTRQILHNPCMINWTVFQQIKDLYERYGLFEQTARVQREMNEFLTKLDPDRKQYTFNMPHFVGRVIAPYYPNQPPDVPAPVLFPPAMVQNLHQRDRFDQHPRIPLATPQPDMPIDPYPQLQLEHWDVMWERMFIMIGYGGILGYALDTPEWRYWWTAFFHSLRNVLRVHDNSHPVHDTLLDVNRLFDPISIMRSLCPQLRQVTVDTAGSFTKFTFLVDLNVYINTSFLYHVIQTLDNTSAQHPCELLATSSKGGRLVPLAIHRRTSYYHNLYAFSIIMPYAFAQEFTMLVRNRFYQIWTPPHVSVPTCLPLDPRTYVSYSPDGTVMRVWWMETVLPAIGQGGSRYLARTNEAAIVRLLHTFISDDLDERLFEIRRGEWVVAVNRDSNIYPHPGASYMIDLYNVETGGFNSRLGADPLAFDDAEDSVLHEIHFQLPIGTQPFIRLEVERWAGRRVTITAESLTDLQLLIDYLCIREI